MRFESSALAAIAALASVDANIVERDDGIGKPRDVTNPSNHGNHELAPAESTRAWAKITKTDVVEQDDGSTSLIPVKPVSSELASLEFPSAWSESPLHPSEESVLKNVPLTTPPRHDDSKSQGMDPIHSPDLGIFEKNPRLKEEVQSLPDDLLEDEFEMLARDLEETTCKSICGDFYPLPQFEDGASLRSAIEAYCENSGYVGSSCVFNANKPINCWNVREVEDMSVMFKDQTSFNEPLNCWNVTKVTNMNHMFKGASAFNQPVNNWNVTKVTNMNSMFFRASVFNQPVNDWNVANVRNMMRMFSYTNTFNRPVKDWNVEKVTTLHQMFNGAYAFNQPLNEWNVSQLDDMGQFFRLSAFNQPVNEWNLSRVTTIGQMFTNASAFNQPVNDWNVSQVQFMNGVFSGASVFNQPVNDWNVSKVSYMASMFDVAVAFNQSVDEWDVGQVLIMESMFADAVAFNQPVNQWNVSRVTNMRNMFHKASAFNQPVNDWNVSRVSYMDYMFEEASAFNQTVNDWDVSRVSFMGGMFKKASAFNQCLAKWPSKVPEYTNTDEMFSQSACPHIVPSKDDNTWCQNECTVTLPKPFSIYKVERATNAEGQYANVNNDNPVTIETFFKAKNEDHIALELFHSVPDGTSCTRGSPLVPGTNPTVTKIKDNAEDSTATYKAEYVIDVNTLVGTPAYDSSTGTIKICTTVGKKINYVNGSQELKYISVVETSFTLTVDMTATLSSDFVQTVNIEFDDKGGQETGTITNSVPVDTFLCAPFRNADSTFKMGDKFGICVRPGANAILNGYNVKKFESVVCSNDDTTQTLISDSVIQNKLTELLTDMSNTFDQEGNPAGPHAAGFTSHVTAGFFVNKAKTSFECNGRVSLDRSATRKSRQRHLQEDSKTSPFSTTIVLDTKNVASLSADASMVSCVGVLLLSVLVAIM